MINFAKTFPISKNNLIEWKLDSSSYKMTFIFSLILEEGVPQKDFAYIFHHLWKKNVENDWKEKILKAAKINSLIC